MATIAWTEDAQRRLEDIFEYIAADNPHAAARTVQGIYERAQVLAEFPRKCLGRRGRQHLVSRLPIRASRCRARTPVLL
ncbi:MAG: type II toxin-antitoxin system RelE/ParE family toxin [Betaproteobacteria bacterium]|nr:type II toxin-antitoxin system RelE/ParE family toxin [Betaproteobacteria bacterium]